MCLQNDARWLLAQNLSSNKTSCPQHSNQAIAIRAPPVVILSTQFVKLIKLHHGIGGRKCIVDDVGFNDRHLAGNFTESLKREQRVVQMIEDSEKECDVERSNVCLRSSSYTLISRNSAFESRACRAREKVGRLPAIG